MSWEKEGYVVLKNAISEDVCKILADQFRILRDNFLHYGNGKFENSDAQVPNSFSYYGFYGFEALLQGSCKCLVEKETGLSVHPAYSYARIYYNNAEMKIHKDRPSCQISVTCCIDADQESWPIGFINRKGEKVQIHQNAGDIIIYSGCELEHWRDEYKGDEQVQAFLHYVDANGPFSDFIYDKRAMLGLPPVK
jgi:hypothetical protein